MITHILRNTSSAQLIEAIHWTADNLHIPAGLITDEVAVAYVVRHFKSGSLEGWDGFVTDIRGN